MRDDRIPDEMWAVSVAHLTGSEIPDTPPGPRKRYTAAKPGPERGMGLDILFGFSGRINRAKYWLATLIQVIFFYGAVFIAVVLVDAFDGATAEYRYSPFP